MMNTKAAQLFAVLNNDDPDQGQKEQNPTCTISDVWISVFG
jgi:hypothetical protein